ncbi:MAG: hypothetical protein QXH40_00820 [Candidatus Bathyarchaeia archaeon]
MMKEWLISLKNKLKVYVKVFIGVVIVFLGSLMIGLPLYLQWSHQWISGIYPLFFMLGIILLLIGLAIAIHHTILYYLE